MASLYLVTLCYFPVLNNCSNWILVSINRNVSFEINKQKAPAGLCFVAFLMLLVLVKPSVMCVLRACLELWQVGLHGSLAALLWTRVWYDVDATYCLSDSQRRSWLFLFQFSYSLYIRSVFIYLPQSSKKACSRKAEGSYVINNILNVIFQLYSFLSFW